MWETSLFNISAGWNSEKQDPFCFVLLVVMIINRISYLALSRCESPVPAGCSFICFVPLSSMCPLVKMYSKFYNQDSLIHNLKRQRISSWLGMSATEAAFCGFVRGYILGEAVA